MMVMGTTVVRKVGEKVEVTGSRGPLVDPIIPGIVMGEATYEDWINQDDPPQYFSRTEAEYRKCNFYFVSVD